MNRVSLLLVASLVACGGSKPNQTNLAPLPDDKPATAAVEEKKPEPPAEPPKPLDPVEVKLEIPAATVKLVKAGTGKKAPLKYNAKVGNKQAVELVMSFSQSAAANGESDEQAVPPIVLRGEAETKAVDASGKVDYVFAASAVDAQALPDNSVPLDKFKIAIASLGGLVIQGSIDGQGSMVETTMRVEKPDQLTTGAVDLLRTTLPIFPMLPKEPVGAGAKWQATRTITLKPSAEAAMGIEMQHVTDYELVSKKGSVWTIKSKTKITGKDQELGGGAAKISKITGTGTQEITLEDGALYPTFTSKLESSLNVTLKNPKTGADEQQQHGFKIGGQVTAKAGAATATAPTTPAPAPAPAPKQ